MDTVTPSICRNCLAFCPILVTVRDGRAVKVTGDPSAQLYDGYSCPKGRALPEQHNDPARLSSCLRRDDAGGFEPQQSGNMIAEIADRVRAIVEQHGPRSVAAYIGTGVVSHPVGASMAAAWFRALRSPMIFSAATIDKPAANTSTALHGNWMAGAQRFAASDTWMIVGANPVISKSNGAPYYNPGSRLKEAVNDGLELIVIDPRRTETARRAKLHLQARPGEDPTILAAMLNIIIRDRLFDAQFVEQHAHGFDALHAAVAPFTPEYAAERAGLPAAQLIEAAQMFGRAKRGGVVCSTGPSFSTRSTLTFYLALCLNTICGRWGREGDLATYPNVMLPAFQPKAQAYPPYPVFGQSAMRVRGLRENASGLPTAALADEILTAGPGQIKALFCLGGNPMRAWPDQARTREALKSLDLLVVSDYRMTATAEFADYVVASPLTLEVPAATYFVESLKYIGVSRGFDVPWAQYTPKIVDPPAGADLLDDRELFHRLAQQMNLQLEWVDHFGYGPHVESPSRRTKLDMTRVPSVDELIELTCGEGRVLLSEVKRHPHGRLFDEIHVPIAAPDPGNAARLELGDALMMQALAEVRQQRSAPTNIDGACFSLISRRMNNYMNSVGQNVDVLNGGKHTEPVFMHSIDVTNLRVSAGDLVEIRSASGSTVACVDVDDTLRPGVVSMPQGAFVGDRASHRGVGVTALIGLDECEHITGMPRLSAVPVSIAKWV